MVVFHLFKMYTSVYRCLLFLPFLLQVDQAGRERRKSGRRRVKKIREFYDVIKCKLLLLCGTATSPCWHLTSPEFSSRVWNIIPGKYAQPKNETKEKKRRLTESFQTQEMRKIRELNIIILFSIHELWVDFQENHWGFLSWKPTWLALHQRRERNPISWEVRSLRRRRILFTCIFEIGNLA